MSNTLSERYQRFLGIIANKRKEADLTQAQLAERLGKPQSYISKYESGERRLDVIEFMAVAEAIGCDPSAIIAALGSKAVHLKTSRRSKKS